MGLTPIEWTDFTHNLWWGCQEILDPDGPDGEDPACHGCYARVRSENPYWWGKTPIFPVWGQGAGRRFFIDAHYAEPLKWNKAAEKAGKPARVFCMSMGDWAEGRPDQKPILDRWLFPMIELTPWLIWLLLTKRPQLANSLVPERWREDGWPVNAWPGTTAVTQKWWDIRLPHLMRIPASRQFVSVEPQMQKIDIHEPFGGPLPSWIIAGGMSGKIAVPSHPDWFRSLRNQCLDAGVAFHFKQHGEFADWSTLQDHPTPSQTDVFVRPDGSFSPVRDIVLDENSPGVFMRRVGKKAAGRLLDGRTWDEVPEMVK